MKILFFGDIFGQAGREAIKQILPKLKKELEPDLIIANGENLAHGKGISRAGLEEVLEAGLDLVTSGNHVWRNKEIYSLLQDKNIPLIRPANYPAGVEGQGYRFIEVGTKKVLVINLIGRVFMTEQCDDPFQVVDSILEEEAGETPFIIVDFHAEATSEKKALGYYLDGRVSAVLGTHTHVPTADSQLLPQGTAYISDVGMVGPHDSILGVDKDVILKMFKTQIPQAMQPAQGQVEVDAVLLELDNRGRAEKIKLIQEIAG